jgi:hypothetical protein
VALQPSKLERFTAGGLVLALALSLLAPAPGYATAASTSGSPAHEIGAGNPGCVGAVPSAPERSRLPADAGLVSFHVLAAAASRGPFTCLVTTLVGGAAPALARWRLAHGTATSSP